MCLYVLYRHINVLKIDTTCVNITTSVESAWKLLLIAVPLILI